LCLRCLGHGRLALCRGHAELFRRRPCRLVYQFRSHDPHSASGQSPTHLNLVLLSTTVAPSLPTAGHPPERECGRARDASFPSPRTNRLCRGLDALGRGGERGSVSVRGTRRSSRSAKPAGQIFPSPLCRYRPRMALRPSGLCFIRFGLRSVAETVSGSPGETSPPPRSFLAGTNNGRMEHRFQDGPITNVLCLARVTATERSRRLRGLAFACSSRLDSTVRRNTPRPTSGAASRSLAQCSL
jgi:hypothetical protein